MNDELRKKIWHVNNAVMSCGTPIISVISNANTQVVMSRHKYTIVCIITRKVYVNKVNIMASITRAAKILTNVSGFMRKEIMVGIQYNYCSS